MILFMYVRAPAHPLKHEQDHQVVNLAHSPTKPKILRTFPKQVCGARLSGNGGRCVSFDTAPPSPLLQKASTVINVAHSSNSRGTVQQSKHMFNFAEFL